MNIYCILNTCTVGRPFPTQKWVYALLPWSRSVELAQALLLQVEIAQTKVSSLQHHSNKTKVQILLFSIYLYLLLHYLFEIWDYGFCYITIYDYAMSYAITFESILKHLSLLDFLNPGLNSWIEQWSRRLRYELHSASYALRWKLLAEILKDIQTCSSFYEVLGWVLCL